MMPMSGFERDSLRAAWQAKRQWAAQFVVNAAVLLASYGWLRIPDSHAWQLLLSVAVGVAIVFATSLLQTLTLLHFAERHSGIVDPRRFSHALRRVPLLLLILLAFLATERLASLAQPYLPQTAGYVQHTLPGAARAHTTPQNVDRGMQIMANALQYFFIPALFLPLLSIVSAQGLRGLNPRLWLTRIFHWRWLIFYALALAIGWMIPMYLANKVLKVNGVVAQATSLTARMILAYCLVVTVWICVTSALGRLLAMSSSDTARQS